jgi:hypothetical protein
VLLIGEHGEYPLTDTGQIMYPRRRFFEETVKVFERSGRVVPVFTDKHLAWNWEDSRWIFDTAQRIKIPLMAGSSVPGTWRHPALDAKHGARIKEVVGLSCGPLEGYAYHALEAIQSIVERRLGGESGIRSVQLVEGRSIWESGRFDMGLFEAAANRREAKGRFSGALKDAMDPATFFIEYADGLKVTLLHDMGSANSEWVTAWREEGSTEPKAVVHYTQEARPFGHFTFLLQGIERMILTGKPSWPAERTLLVSGILATAFESLRLGQTRLETPHLKIRYGPGPGYKEPPPAPPDRPIGGQ